MHSRVYVRASKIKMLPGSEGAAAAAKAATQGLIEGNHLELQQLEDYVENDLDGVSLEKLLSPALPVFRLCYLSFFCELLLVDGMLLHHLPLLWSHSLLVHSFLVLGIFSLMS